MAFIPATLQASFQKLSAASQKLNTASNAFGDAIAGLDEALNNLNPGVTAWINVNSSQDENGSVQEERLGYAKTNGRWGLSLCSVTFPSSQPDHEEVENSWLFNDAPRNLRLVAIDHVPALIHALAKQAEHTADRVAQSADLALDIARSVNAAANAKEARR